MNLTTLQQIEHALDSLPPQDLAELYAWLDRRRPPNAAPSGATLFEQRLGLFGSPDDAALIDEVVHIAYEERCRPSRPVLPRRSRADVQGSPRYGHTWHFSVQARKQFHGRVTLVNVLPSVASGVANNNPVMPRRSCFRSPKSFWRGQASWPVAV
jgi:hypothetical protein